MRIVAGPSSVSDDRWVVSLNRPDGGVLAAAARPLSEAFWSIGAAVHQALGQQAPLLTTTARDRVLLGAWVEAYRVRDVIVHHADRFPAEVLLDVERLLGVAGAELWVVVDDSIHALVVQEVEDLAPATPVAWADFRRHWSSVAASPRTVPEGASSRLDPVPAWATQHERLLRASTRGMDLPYLEGFCAAARWTRSERPRKTEITARIRACLARYEDPGCFVGAARGVAVALHELGWQMTLDVERLARTASGSPLTRPDDVARMAQVRHFRDPGIAAATALTGLDLARDEILGLEVGDVSEDGDRITLWHDVVAVPQVVAPVMRAQRILRLRDDARAGDAFLVDGPRPLSTRRFATLVLAGLEELGRDIPRAALEDRPGADERWLLERGVALGWIARLDRRSIGPAGMSGAAVLAQVVGRLADPGEIERRTSCRCSDEHEQPAPPEPGTWPWPPRHAPPPAGHPWRQSAFRRSG